MLLQQLLALSLLLSASQAGLFQINRNKTLCTGEEAVFLCSTDGGPVVRWTVITLRGTKAGFSLHSTFKLSETKMIDSSTIDGEIIFSNSTFHFMSILTLAPPVSCAIECNSLTITYQLQNYSEYLPTYLILTPQPSSDQYNITWTPDWSVIYPYLVTITPPFLNESSEVTSTASVDLHLEASTIDNIEISFYKCSDLYSIIFELGCLLSPPHSLEVISYSISSDGVFSAQAKCNSTDNILTLVCHNKTWLDPGRNSCVPVLSKNTQTDSRIQKNITETITIQMLPIVIITVTIITAIIIAVVIALIITSILIASKLHRSRTRKKNILQIDSTKQYEIQDKFYQHLDRTYPQTDNNGENHLSTRITEPEYSTLNNCPTPTLHKAYNSNFHLQLQQDSNIKQYGTLNRGEQDTKKEEAGVYCTIGAITTDEDPHENSPPKLLKQSDRAVEYEESQIPPPIPPQATDIMDGLEES